jgi:hypothetical protein
MVSPLTSEKGTIPDVQFSIDEPVVAGDLEVTGQGPVGVPLQLVNISSGGKVLSSTTIDKNNYFKFSLAKPLKDGHIIGIQLAAAKNPDTWLELWAQRGDNARAIPRLGDFFDSTIVSSSL